MTLNHFLEAASATLTAIWPGRRVYTDRIPAGADGSFFIGIIESSQEAHLDRRRKRSIQFEILYFLRSDDSMAFHDWAEAMYDRFEQLQVAEADGHTRTVRLTNRRARRDSAERVYQFLFDAEFFVVLAPEPAPNMETLDQKEVLKE